MAVPIEEVNYAITLNKLLLAKLTSPNPSKYCADSVSTTLGQQGSTLDHRQTDDCYPAAHAQRGNHVYIAIVCI